MRKARPYNRQDPVFKKQNVRIEITARESLACMRVEPETAVHTE